jgi:hypothetical protein
MRPTNDIPRPAAPTTRGRPTAGRLRWLFVLAAGVVLALPLWMGLKILKTDNWQIWIPAYLSDLAAGRYGTNDESRHLIVLMCDHWEPGRGAAGLERADWWLDRYEQAAARHVDSQGRPFQYSWFYPIDTFDQAVIERVAATARAGLGEIEVHWHHEHQDGQTFAADLAAALPLFTRVGALAPDEDAPARFGFIHGNWTLDNSGVAEWCGVDEEIQILQEHGCYADFTFPALWKTSQPRIINRIFYAEDTPGPKSYDETGVVAKVGAPGRGLMLLPGPLGLDFQDPRIFMECGSLDDSQGSGLTGRVFAPATTAGYFKPHRVGLWDRLGVGVQGRPEWVFAKLHAHGVADRELFFGGALEAMLDAVEEYCRRRGLGLHYVTAREAYNIARAAEAGLTGDPALYYDYEIPAPGTRLGEAGELAEAAAPADR